MPSALSTFGNSLSLRVDGAIGAMSLNPNGRDAVLAGRRGLFIIDLDDPFTAPRWLHHITLWEVADVQWSPHHTVKPLWVILTLNQRALLWDLNRPLANAIAHVLHGHTRAITDINFHPGDPELLATCAVDTFALAWDMRAPRTPAMKWAEWRAGATQVKWNHQNQYQIATCHDHSFYIWDTRKGALPMVKIRGAHAGKINGLDFSRGLSQIITSSNDHKVKVWDLTTPQAEAYIDKFDYFSLANTNRGGPARVTPQVVVDCEFPVAKTRWLPFGSDSACGIMPLRGGNHAIHIANLLFASSVSKEGEAVPLLEVGVHQFEGHTGDIKDFLWRQRHQHYLDGTLYPGKDYQLVTWLSHDYDLKLWSNDDPLGDLYSKVNYNPSFVPVLDDSADEEVVYDYNTYLYEPPVTIDDMRSITCGDTLLSLALLEINAAKKDHARLGNVDHLDWILGVRLGGKRVDADGYPTNLGEEVSIVGRKFPKVRFEKILVSTGEIVVSFRGVRPEVVKEEKVPEPADYSLTNEDETGTVTSAGKLTLKPEDNPPASASLLGPSDSVTLVFMRLQIDFPPLYPFLSATSKKRRNLVRFRLEETHELDSDAISTIETQLDEIAQFYSNKHQKFCLEPCLRMLMGEKIELDDEALAAAVGDANDGTLEAIEEVASEHSEMLMVVSDDDDDNSEEPNNTVADDFDDNALEFAEPPLQNVHFFDLTPVPKGCGATWTPTGQLVCFFVPTEDRPKKLDIFHFAELGADDANITTAPVSENDTSDDLDFSRAEDESSSDDDSFQEEWDALIASDAPLRARVPALFKTVVGLGNEYGGLLSHKHPGKLVGGGTTNNNHLLLVRRLQKHRKNLNIVGIFDYSHLMQAKVELGYEYRILGDAPEQLARHNGEVAAKYGLTDIAQTWRLLEMALIKNVDNLGTLEPMGNQLFQHGFEVPANLWDPEGRVYTLKPMFFWGHHPFGHSWLVKELFTYYEQQGNIQMLAMMACILHENARNLHLQDDLVKVPIHTPYRALPPPPTVLALVPGELVMTKQTWQPALSLALEIMLRLNLVMSLPKLKHKRPLIPTVGTPNSAPLYGPMMTTATTTTTNKKRLAKKVRLPPTVTIEMVNMDLMDIYDDAYLCGLLSSLDPETLRRYRQQYADLLYLWGLPVNRIKVLKFNYANGLATDTDGDQHKCHIALRSRRKQNPRLAFVNLVTFIELSKLNAWNLGKRTVLKYCNLCALVVKKNFVVCTLCEHILHTQCAMEWWGENEQECASGCGCNCLTRPFSTHP